MINLHPHQQSALEAMIENYKGQIIMPTGAGKTITMIYDSINQLKESTDKVIVVVSPRILLTCQLCSEFMQYIDDTHVLHVHSGDTEYFKSTNPSVIRNWVDNISGNKILFTTYNSLKKIEESQIEVDTIYFDEAHNSVKRNFFDSTKYFSQNSSRCYFFTATPKHSHVSSKPGMNDFNVYGKVISTTPATELVDKGMILPPKMMVTNIDMDRDKEYGAERDCMTLLDTILNEDNMEKVLVTAPNTKVLIRMLAETEFMQEVRANGYDVLWITAKHGAFINNKKVKKDVFFDTLSKWGEDPDKKFIILHYSILSEGINCPGLTSTIMMRNMDIIQMCQTIGRVIRVGSEDREKISKGELQMGDFDNYSKAYGMIHVPVYVNTGKQTAKQLENIIDTVFVKGDIAISSIKR